MAKYICYCSSCIQYNGKSVALSTWLKHASNMRKDDCRPETNSWLQHVFGSKEETNILRNKYNISEEDINELIAVFNKLSPRDNILPKSFTEVDQLTRDLVVHHKEHIICRCEEFRFVDEEKCMMCQRARSEGNKYYSIPIGPRIQQLKEVSALAKLTAKTATQPLQRFINDLHMSPAWNNFQNTMGNNAVALSYCSDGFNPFHHIITQGSYSIWAQSGLVLNFPPEFRTKIGTTLLYGIIPGPFAPKKLNVYNEVVVNELEELARGLPIFNAATNTREIIKVGVLYMVCDVPGLAKEQNRVQQNAKTSCSHCSIEGQHNHILDKTVYPGSRKFLSTEDPLRQDTSFPSGKPESTVVNLRSTRDELAVARYQDCLLKEMKEMGKKNATLISALAQQTGRYGSNHWFRLNLDLQQMHAPVEPMHVIKVFAEHMTKLLNGDEDGPKVRAAEREAGRFKETCPDAVYRVYVKEKKTIGQKIADNATEGDNALQKKFPKNSLPPAPFTLTTAEKNLADQRLASIKVPVQFGVIPATLFTRICGGVKSHTWLQLFTHGVLRFCLRGMLGQQQRSTLFKVLSLLETLFNPTMDVNNMPEVKSQWHQALALLERDFPVSLQTYVLHLLHHLPAYIQLYGPPHNFWMYPYERFNHTLSDAVSNNKNPELTAVKKIEIQWLLAMLEAAGHLPSSSSSMDASRSVSYISSGRHKPLNRPATTEELQLIVDCVGEACPDITVCHYAKVGDNMYRDASVEHDDQREKACIIQYNGYLGKIAFFFLAKTGNIQHELAFINVYGQPHRCQDSNCFYITVPKDPSNKVIPVESLSPALIHMYDGDVLWVPCL